MAPQCRCSNTTDCQVLSPFCPWSLPGRKSELSMQPMAEAVGQEKGGSTPLVQLVLVGKVEVAVERYLISRAA